jgi:hypothetical protein
MLLRELPASEQAHPDSSISSVHTILKDAGARIAQLMGLPENAVRLNYDVDPTMRHRLEG